MNIQNCLFLGFSDDVRRVVGLLQYPHSGVNSHSFLVIGNGFEIDNAFYERAMSGLTPTQYMHQTQKERQLDEDPGTTKREVVDGGFFKIEYVGREKLRLVCTPDEKMEQKLAYEITCGFKPRWVIYDLKMRKYIKVKYGIEIPSLAQKWHRLCWTCFTPGDQLKCCAECKIALYCSKSCQRQDWKVHKELHGMQTEIEREESSNLHF